MNLVNSFDLNNITYTSHQKFNRNILIADSVFASLFFICALIFMCTYLYLKPFPERTTIAEMDANMLAKHEDVNLNIMVSFAFLSIIFFFAHFILSFIIFYYYFALHTYEFERFKFLNNIIIKYILRILFLICYWAIGCFLISYFWFVYFKEYYQKHEGQNFIINHAKIDKPNLRAKIAWILIIILLPLIGIASAFIYLYSNKPINSRMPISNAQKYLTLSDNHPNVVYFYFDRLCGLTWNTLLYLDEIINQKNSFANLFPEFTTYINSLSSCCITKYSNPTIYAGSCFSQFVKNTNLTNIATNEINNSMNINDWYYGGFKQMFSMFLNYNFNDLGIEDVPYYSTSKSAQYGDLYQLQLDLKNRDNIDIVSIDSQRLCESKGYYLKNIDNEKLYMLHTYDNLQNWFEFKHTNTNVYRGFFTQITHGPYTYIKGDREEVTNGDNVNYYKSEWYALQQLKEILWKFKTTPYVDDNNQQIYDSNNKPISVYDKTTFVLLSDHGNAWNYEDYLNYLKTQNIINNYEYENLNQKVMHQIVQYNPFVCIKPFNYDNKNNLINFQPNFNYDQDKIIFLSDLSIIVENYLKQYYHISNNQSMFIPASNSGYDQYISKQILANPLDSQFNSIKNHNLINRELYMSDCYNWQFMPYQETYFKMLYPIKFKLNKTANSIYNLNNITNLN